MNKKYKVCNLHNVRKLQIVTDLRLHSSIFNMHQNNIKYLIKNNLHNIIFN